MEDTNDSGRYAQLKSRKREDSFHVRNGFTNLSPPIDTYNTVYLSFVLGGAGFLFPYNRYVLINTIQINFFGLLFKSGDRSQNRDVTRFPFYVSAFLICN